jgi:undecaprenyl-diphosphatase
MKNIILDFIDVAVLAVVEGVTEWLPVSSTGHMILVDEFLTLDVSLEYLEMFLVVIQLGAILAIMFLYFARLNPLTFVNHKPTIKKETIIMWLKIIVACLPAAAVGLLFDDQINELFYNYQTVAIMLIVVGIVFIVVETFHARKNINPKITSIAQITYSTALIIGMFQLVSAIFPGTSRSGATIIGALMLGVSRTVATEFTFFLAVPVMFGASALKLFKFGFNFTLQEIAMLIFGMAIAFIVSILTINFLLSYITKHNFKLFGWYRIILGIAVLVYFAVVM